MELPHSNHIVWKFAAVIVLFGGLSASKYLGYDHFEAWKDIRAAIIETLGIAALWFGRSMFMSHACKGDNEDKKDDKDG